MNTRKIFTVFGFLVLIARLACADPGVTPSAITLGMSLPLSGPNSANGQDILRTVTAYVGKVNKSGGVNGRRIELVALDDGYETEKAVANAKALINDKHVFALLGFYGSSPTIEAMNGVFGPARVPLVGAISGAEALYQPPSVHANNQYMFNVRASYADETEVIVNQLTSIGIQKIAVLYQNDDFGKSGLNGISAALKKHNLTPVAQGSVERNSGEVEKALESIRKASPQAVVMITVSQPAVAFVKAMKKTGQSPVFMALSAVGTKQLIHELGDDARGIGVSQVMPYPWNDTIALVQEYQRLIQNKEDFSYMGLEGYLMARVMVEALRRSGKDVSRENLIRSLESMSDQDFGGYWLHYGPNKRTASHFVELTVIGPGGRIVK